MTTPKRRMTTPKRRIQRANFFCYACRAAKSACDSVRKILGSMMSRATNNSFDFLKVDQPIREDWFGLHCHYRQSRPYGSFSSVLTDKDWLTFAKSTLFHRSPLQTNILIVPPLQLARITSCICSRIRNMPAANQTVSAKFP